MSTSLTLAQLSEYFHLPEKQVAAQMGMCLTSLKKVCRAHGITRWPFRKLKSLERTMQKKKEDSSAPSPMPKPGTSSAAVMQKEPLGKEPLGKEPKVQVETLSISTDATPQLSPHPPSGPLDQLHWNLHQDLTDTASKRTNALNLEENWPSCALDANNSNLLIVTNWSTLWTVQKLRQHLLKALGGSEIKFSEDGSQAFLWYTTYLAAMQARTVCDKACTQLKDYFTQQEAPGKNTDSAANQADDLPHSSHDEHDLHLFASNADYESLVESTPGRALIESSMRKANLHPLDGKGWGNNLEPLPPTCAPSSHGGMPHQPGSSGSSGADWESHEWCLISC